MQNFIPNLIEKGTYDVLVVGGGVAGVSAAISASRDGKKVCLFEKSVSLGGLATIGLVNWYEPLCDGKGTKIMSGLAEELLKLSVKDGFNTLDFKWYENNKMDKDDRRYSTFFSPTLFQIKLNELLVKEGVTIRYDSLATYPIMEENKILGLVVETISGSEYYEGKVVIDATGAATIFDRAGALCKTGENYLGYLTYIADFNKGVNQRIDLRSWDYSGSNMSGFGQPEDIGMLTGDSSDDVNVMMTKGQLLLLDKMKEDTNKEIVNVPAMPQFRMIKHMIGEYELNESDLFKHFEDSVGVVGNFLTRGEWLEIPMRSLINKDFPNLLPAGRIVSAHGKAWDITRVIPAAVLTGEVSGIMASMAIDNNIDVKDIDVSKLQKKLVNVGIILHHE